MRSIAVRSSGVRVMAAALANWARWAAVRVPGIGIRCGPRDNIQARAVAGVDQPRCAQNARNAFIFSVLSVKFGSVKRGFVGRKPSVGIAIGLSPSMPRAKGENGTKATPSAAQA